MRRFPYRPRTPHVPPESPEPETPESSDWRLYAVMLRIVFTAVMLVVGYAVLVSLGATGGLSGLVILVFAIMTAAVPDLRDMARRGWFWYWPWWNRHGAFDDLLDDLGDDPGDDF
jgi:hypothetical protein